MAQNEICPYIGHFWADLADFLFGDMLNFYEVKRCQLHPLTAIENN